MPRCDYEVHGGYGPRCILEDGHHGPHHFRCAGPSCEGYPYPASVLAHPAACAEKSAELADAIERGDYELVHDAALDSGDPLELAAAVDGIIARAIERHRRRFTLGTRVKALRGFSGVPIGTLGVVDEHYAGGVMVAWDLEDRPLAGPTLKGPEAYAEAIRGGYKPRPQFAMGAPLRDGFAYNELEYLEVLPEAEARRA